jgi:periplasmic protein CpxP/Spy
MDRSHLAVIPAASLRDQQPKEGIMSDINTAAPQPPLQSPLPKVRQPFTNSRWFIGAVIVSVGLIGFGVGRVTGWRGTWMGHAQMQGDGPGMHRGMAGPRGPFGFGPETFIDRMLGQVNATPEQKQKVTQIAQGAFSEMRPLREQRRAAQTQLATLLKADTIDRAAIDKLRLEQLTTAEAVTKRLGQAIAEAAEVLTPAQRQQLVERWENRRRFWRG